MPLNYGADAFSSALFTLHQIGFYQSMTDRDDWPVILCDKLIRRGWNPRIRLGLDINRFGMVSAGNDKRDRRTDGKLTREGQVCVVNRSLAPLRQPTHTLFFFVTICHQRRT